jgi:outer membrane biosynthesis protein TonB
MAMERRVLHMILFLAVLLVAAASVATARELASIEKAVVGDTESQPSTLHPGVSDDDEFKKQQLAEGTQYSEVSDEGKSVEDNNSDEEELAEDNGDDDGFNDEDKKTNHHPKAPKKANPHPKPPKKSNHHPKPPKKPHHHPKPPKKGKYAADDSNSNDETEDANP